MQMKIICLILAVVLLTGCLCGCSATEIAGIENFTSIESSLELNNYLLPNNEDFLKSYPYIHGEYSYSAKDTFKDIYAKTIVTLQYDAAAYEAAKQFCLESFQFTQRQYNLQDWVFYERDYYPMYSFPTEITMFGYKDSTCELIFFRYLNTKDNSSEKELANTDFGQFYENTFDK